MTVVHRNLDAELADPATLVALAVAELIELPDCHYPRIHAKPSVRMDERGGA